jgi:hypothetical protein
MSTLDKDWNDAFAKEQNGLNEYASRRAGELDKDPDLGWFTLEPVPDKPGIYLVSMRGLTSDYRFTTVAVTMDLRLFERQAALFSQTLWDWQMKENGLMPDGSKQDSETDAGEVWGGR